MEGHPEMVELLLQFHADVNVKNNVSILNHVPASLPFTPYNINLEILILLLNNIFVAAEAAKIKITNNFQPNH